MNKSEIAELLEKGQNTVYDELRQIYCCKGAEFARPTLEKAWKEIARLERAIAESQAPPKWNCPEMDAMCANCERSYGQHFKDFCTSDRKGTKFGELGDGEPSPANRWDQFAFRALQKIADKRPTLEQDI